MELSLTAMVTLNAIQHLIDIDLVTAAAIIIHGTEGPSTIDLYLGAGLMVTTESHLCNRVELLTPITFEQVQVGPHLPVNFLP